MTVLLVGLFLFLGVHCARIFASGFRARLIEQKGENFWKGLYSVLSILGFVLLIYGYGLAREDAEAIYDPVSGSRGLSFIIMPIALILVIASQLPAGHIKKWVSHPMLWGVVLWSLVHLSMNGDSASVLLFGAFLAWGIADLISCYRRPSAPAADVVAWPDIVAIAAGLLLTWAFLSFAHEWLAGVAIA